MTDKELKERLDKIIKNLDNLIKNNDRDASQKDAALKNAYNLINQLSNDDDTKKYLDAFKKTYSDNKKVLEEKEKELTEEDKLNNTTHIKNPMLTNLEDMDKKVKGVSDRIESVLKIAKEFDEEDYKAALDTILFAAEQTAEKRNKEYAEYCEPIDEIGELTADDVDELDETEKTISLFKEYNAITAEISIEKIANPVNDEKINELNEKLKVAKEKIANQLKDKALLKNAIKIDNNGNVEYITLEECLEKGLSLRDFIYESIYDKNNPTVVKDGLEKRYQALKNNIYNSIKNNTEMASRYNKMYSDDIQNATDDKLEQFLEESVKIKDSLKQKAMIANKKVNNIKEIKERLELERNVSDYEYFQKTASDKEKENVSLIIQNSTMKHKDRRYFWKEQGYSGLVAFFKAFSKKKTFAMAQQIQYSTFKKQRKNNRMNNFKANLQKISRDNNREVNENDKASAYDLTLENDRSDEGR